MTTLADWCSKRRWFVVTGWGVLLVGLLAAVVLAGARFTDATSMPATEAATATELLGQGAPPTEATESGKIVWHTDGTTVRDPDVQRTFTSMMDEIAATPGVQSVTSPYTGAGTTQIDPASTTAFATVTFDAGSDAIDSARSSAESARSDSVDVEVGGQAFAVQPGGGSHVTEGLGIVLAFVVLLLVFRSLWAAALPIITGLVGVATSLLVVVLASNILDIAATALTMGALIGLGVGIDYALFIVNRYRSALTSGESVRDSISTAVTTSGRAVVFAGLTVVIALLGMIVVQFGILTTMAQAAAVTVVFTVVAAITLLPALLAILGDRVLSTSGRKVYRGQVQPVTHTTGARTVWQRWASVVLNSPGRIALAATAVMVVVAAPVTMMHVGSADASSDPLGSPSNSYYQVMSNGFGEGIDAPIVLAAQTPNAASVAAFADMTAGLSSLDNVASVSPATAGADGTSSATVIPGTSAQATETTDLVDMLRTQIIPGAESGTDLQVYVGGVSASDIDISDALLDKLPVYLVLVALLGFLLLAVAFRSILMPLIGAVSNIFTLLTGLGAITAIFQFGWGTELLGVGAAAPVEFLVPILIVGVMFGLSMDYQVFLVSRMHEEWDRTGDHERSIRIGIGETGRVIATAATIMLCVFASFGFSGERIVAAIGIGLAVAVLLDAFVVRLTVMPALLKLVGPRAWAYPRWADRLTPNLSIEGPSRNDTVDEDYLLETATK